MTLRVRTIHGPERIATPAEVRAIRCAYLCRLAALIARERPALLPARVGRGRPILARLRRGGEWAGELRFLRILVLEDIERLRFWVSGKRRRP